MDITPTERRLFKEQIIRDYKLKYANHKQKNHPLNVFLRRSKQLAPVTVMLGIAAAVLLVYKEGWDIFFNLILTGIIWITLITTGVNLLHKSK